MMKRFLFAAVVFLGVVLVPLFCFAASCDSEGSSYYIRFTLDGTAYECNYGATDVNETAFGNVVSGEGQIIFIAGASSYGASTEAPDVGIMIMLNGTTTGTYEGLSEVMIMIIADDVGYELESGSVVLTVAGEAGSGTYEGTFSGVVLEEGENSLNLSNGSFRVQRLADDTFFPDLI